MSVIDNWLPELLEEYGNIAEISKENHANGQIRYRIVTAPNTPGVWISKRETFNKLYDLALNDTNTGNYESLEKKLRPSQVAAA